MLFHFGVVEHSVCRVDWVTYNSNIVKLTSFVVLLALLPHETLRVLGCDDVAVWSYMRLVSGVSCICGYIPIVSFIQFLTRCMVAESFGRASSINRIRLMSQFFSSTKEVFNKQLERASCNYQNCNVSCRNIMCGKSYHFKRPYFSYFTRIYHRTPQFYKF